MSYALVGEFTVKAARNRGNIPNTNGPGELTRWYVDFVDANGEPVKDANGKVADAYWQRKPDSEVTVGDTVYGTISEGQYGLRFKKEKRPDEGGGSGGRGGKREWKPESQYDPEKTARIGRAHAQHMAILTLTEMGSFQTQDAMGLRSKIEDWTSFYQQDVDKAAAQAANQTEGPAARNKEASVPPPEASPSSGSQTPNDEHQWFCKLLEAAHMDPEPAHTLACFIVERFDKDKKARAEHGLEDFDTQRDTLKKLEAAYEKSEGAPLPSGEPEDSIPFRRPEYGEVFDERMRWRF